MSILQFSYRFLLNIQYFFYIDIFSTEHMIFDFSRHWNAEPVLAYTTGKNKTDRFKSLNISLIPIKIFSGTFSDQVHDLETDIFEAV